MQGSDRKIREKAIQACKLLGYLRVPDEIGPPPPEIEVHLGCWVYPPSVKKGGYNKHGIGRVRNQFIMNLNRVMTIDMDGKLSKEKSYEARGSDLLKRTAPVGPGLQD